MPRQASEKNKAFAVDSDEDQSRLQPTQPDNTMIRLAKMMAEDRKRRESQRTALFNEHEKRVKTTQAKITALFRDRRTRVTKSQRELWVRLNELNKRREVIEGKILASMKNIEQQTGNIAAELEVVFMGRIEDIANLDGEWKV